MKEADEHAKTAFKWTVRHCMVKDKHKMGYFYTAGITNAKFAPDVPISILVNQKQKFILKSPKLFTSRENSRTIAA